MKEPELNSENENPQEKKVGHSPAANYSYRDELEHELREAITKITGENKNKTPWPVRNKSVQALTHVE